MIANLESLANNYTYLAAFLIVIAGCIIIVSNSNLLRKIVGLNILQGGVILFYVLIAYFDDSVPPIYTPNMEEEIYSNPLPHVLMLTAIVVGVSAIAVAYSLVYRLYKNYDSIDEATITEINEQ